MNVLKTARTLYNGTNPNKPISEYHHWVMDAARLFGAVVISRAASPPAIGVCQRVHHSTAPLYLSPVVDPTQRQEDKTTPDLEDHDESDSDDGSDNIKGDAYAT